MQHESRTAALLLLVFALGLALGRTGDHRHAAAPPTATGTATVAKVTDGDTVWLSPLGKVRLIGIDTPEVYGHTDCFGPEASAFADRVLRPGTHVRYKIGRESHDRYGRTLAYVWLPDG